MPIPNAFVAAITRKSPSMKLCWTFFFSSGGSPAWKRSASMPAVARKSATSSVRRRVAQYTIAPPFVSGGQMPGQQLVDVVKLLGAGGLGHDELQIRAPAAAVEHRHLDVEMLPEVVDDLLDHFRLGRRGQTQHRRNA